MLSVVRVLSRRGLTPSNAARVFHRLVPAAAMTQSTRRLRKRLTAAGIEFKMPLDPTGDQRDAQVRNTDGVNGRHQFTHGTDHDVDDIL